MACVHDTVITVGAFSLASSFGRSDLELSLTVIAAILTLVGYSMNDTIVVFDRIRENEKLFRDQSFTWICNRSMYDCLSRTILTSATAFMSVLVMWALAGGVIRDFAKTMAIGIVIGTYSTIYIASPLTIYVSKFLEGRKNNHKTATPAKSKPVTA